MHTIRVKLEGENLHPNSFELKELSSFLDIFSKLTSYCSDEEKAQVRLAEMEDNCISLSFCLNRSALKAYAAFIMFQSGLLSTMPFKYNSVVTSMNSFMERNKITVELPLNSRKTIQRNSEQTFQAIETHSMKYTTQIYGELVNIGGSAKINAHIKPLGEKKAIICSLSKEMAKELCNKLYTVVGLAGEAEYINNEIASMKVSSILNYAPQDLGKSPFELLKEAGASKHFDNVDVLEYVRELRG